MKINSFKKTLLAFTLLSFAVFTYAEKPVPASDEYTEEIPEKTSKNKTEKKAKSKSKAKKDLGDSATGFFKEFIFGKDKYVFYDSMMLETGTFGTGIKQREAELLLKPETQEAGIRTYFQTSWFDILFDEPARAKIISSVTRYLADFEGHNLDKKASYLKTRRAYVKLGSCFEQWGTTKVMMSSWGPTYFTCGYEFKKVKDKTSPYFVIIIEKAKNKNDKAGTNVSPESVEVELYFTKSQAKTLVQLLNNDKINDLMVEYYEAQKNGSIAEYDEEYDEEYDDEYYDEIDDSKSTEE